MLTVVVVINLLISVFCLYVAWQVWKLRQGLAAAADSVDAAERSTYAVLHDAPKGIYQTQLGVSELKDRYQQLEIQWQRVEQVLRILVWLQRVWRLSFRRTPKRSPSRRRSRYPEPRR
ncbi:MAG TPA: hypothetical protein DCY91_01775 [Cyanobacteria bacterium UBA11370]|nr:hypothetical protein [Cyanobacteria bacterium UBA11370]HBY81912.1 hypothetical protein [Cyanobacteria bacterium UBA11148]